MQKYVKPEGILDDMGGMETPDERMQEILRLLNYVPCKTGNVLDIGVGKGQISEFFLADTKISSVEGIGLEIDSYGLPNRLLKNNRFHITECTVEKMSFASNKFDIAVASHIYEHVPNMGLALRETRRVLKDGGWLYIFIPKYASMVLAGHINTGWNIGQLIYVLLLNGFDVKNGMFIEYGYSLCAYVQKKEINLPPLRGDRGDIILLDKSDLLPKKIGYYGWEGSSPDGFFGEIAALNWDNAKELLNEKILETYRNYSFPKKISYHMAKIIYKILGRNHTKGFAELLNRFANNTVNPDQL